MGLWRGAAVCLAPAWFQAVLILLLLYPMSTASPRLEQLSACTALVDGQELSLEQLQRTDGRPRFQVEQGGWNYTFNPCSSFNLPLDPHAGTGDQCHYVAMCRSRDTEDEAEFYTLGIQRSVRLQMKRLPRLDLESSSLVESDELEEDWEESDSDEEGEEDEDEDDDSTDEDEEDSDESSSSEEDDEEDGDEDADFLTAVDDTSQSTTDTPLQHEFQSDSPHTNVPHDANGSGEVVTSLTGVEYDPVAVDEPHENSQEITAIIRESRRVQGGDTAVDDRESRMRAKENRKRRKSRRRRERDHSRVRREAEGEEDVDDSDSDHIPVEPLDPELILAGQDVSQDGPDSKPIQMAISGEEGEDEAARLVLRYKGLRSQRSQKTFVVLSCAPEIKSYEGAEFKWLGHRAHTQYFELRHFCCCPGACTEVAIEPEVPASRLTELGDGSEHLWLVVVINFVLILTAIFIGLFCCRNGGSNGPYSMLPGLHSSQMTLGSVESYRAPKRRVFKRPADYLEYSSSLHQKSQLPMLSDCVVLSRDVDIGQRLGGGLFGDTYIGEWKHRTVAIKRFTVGVHQNQITEESRDWLASEVAYITKQRHKYLVTLLAICLDLRQPHIINEYIDGGSLKDLLKQNDAAFSLARKVKMCIQASEGMAFLHSLRRPILHRDLRCSNLLLDKDEKIKIADFGVTKLMQRLRQECTGHERCYCQKHQSAFPASIRWTAPEILAEPGAEEGRNALFTVACDVYSFGMVMWEATTSLDPYEGITDEKQVRDIVLRGARPDLEVLGAMGVNRHFIELIGVCWEQDPENRPLFKHITMHLKSVQQSLLKSDRAAGGAQNDTNSYLRSTFSLHIDQ